MHCGGVHFHTELLLPRPCDAGVLGGGGGAWEEGIFYSFLREQVLGFSISLRPKLEANQGPVREGTWVREEDKGEHIPYISSLSSPGL